MDEVELSQHVAEGDRLVAQGRALIVGAVRDAHAAGMSQRAIAAATGRSQPEISRLLRFHGSSPAGLALRKQKDEVRRIVSNAGLGHVRVFGSVARGEDGPNSDIDLLVHADEPVSLMALSRVERDLEVLLGRSVDLVLDDGIREDLAESIKREAVPL